MAASLPARRVLVPVAAPALLLAGAVAARGVSLLSRPVEDPSEPAFRDAFVLQCLALLMLATALVLALVWAPPPAPGRGADPLDRGRGPGARFLGGRPCACRRGPRASHRVLAAWCRAVRRRLGPVGDDTLPRARPTDHDVGPGRPTGRGRVPRHRRAGDRVRDGRRVHAGARQRTSAGREPRADRGAACLAEPDRGDRGPGEAAAGARPPRRSAAAAAHRVVRDPARDLERGLRGRRTDRSEPRHRPRRHAWPRSTSSGRWRTGSTRRSSGRPVWLPRSRPSRTRRRCSSTPGG